MKPWSLLGLLLSAGLIAVLVRRLDLSAVADSFTDADPAWVLVSTGLYLSTFVLRAWRWRRLLPRGAAELGPCGEAFSIGFAANHVLPARMGDVVRGVALHRIVGLPIPVALSSVGVERILDGLVVVGMAALASSLAPPDSSLAPWLLAGFGALFGGALLFCLLALAARRRLTALGRSFGPRLGAIVEELVDGLEPLRTRPMGPVLLASVAIWSTEVSAYVALAQGTGLQLDVAAWAFCCAVLTLGLVAPSAPGFLGVFEAVLVQALAGYGVAGAPAAAFALLLHAVHALPGTLLGVALALRRGLRPSALRPMPGQIGAR